MEIRLAQTQDIPHILRLLAQVGQVHHQIRPDVFPEGTIKYDAADLTELLKDTQRPIFVALETEQVLGYCFCVVKQIAAGPASTCRRELYIDDLCVDECSRGTGVAQALYRHVCGYGKAEKCDFVTLNVWQGNDRAMAFYEKCGLRPRNIMMEIPLEDKLC